MTNNQGEQKGDFPQEETAEQSTHSTTGDGNPPQPGEGGGRSGGDAGQNTGQQETGGTGGYGGTSDASGQ
jgi:hypothetical protein